MKAKVFASLDRVENVTALKTARLASKNGSQEEIEVLLPFNAPDILRA